MGIWRKSSKWKRAMVARLLERDGHDCWLCGRAMTRPPTKHNKRISLEHLKPRMLGGSDSAENLVLCHQHCNGHLRDRALEKKLAIREKWLAYRAKIAVSARSN